MFRALLKKCRVIGYGLAAVAVSALAANGLYQWVVPHASSNTGNPESTQSHPAIAPSETDCDPFDAYACSPVTQNHTSAPEEVELRSQPKSALSEAMDEDPCDSIDCQVTETPTPLIDIPFPLTDVSLDSGQPPSADDGDSGPVQVPGFSVQQYYERCAEAYGHTLPNPNFKTSYTDNYGWTSDTLTTGYPLLRGVTTSSSPPAQVPAGGSAWKSSRSATYFRQKPYHTNIYMAAYRDTATMVEVLTHEWYHQNNDLRTESDEQRQLNEKNATVAGETARNAFNADNGKQCAQ